MDGVSSGQYTSVLGQIPGLMSHHYRKKGWEAYNKAVDSARRMVIPNDRIEAEFNDGMQRLSQLSRAQDLPSPESVDAEINRMGGEHHAKNRWFGGIIEHLGRVQSEADTLRRMFASQGGQDFGPLGKMDVLSDPGKIPEPLEGDVTPLDVLNHQAPQPNVYEPRVLDVSAMARRTPSGRNKRVARNLIGLANALEGTGIGKSIGQYGKDLQEFSQLQGILDIETELDRRQQSKKQGGSR